MSFDKTKTSAKAPGDNAAASQTNASMQTEAPVRIGHPPNGLRMVLRSRCRLNSHCCVSHIFADGKTNGDGGGTERISSQMDECTIQYDQCELCKKFCLNPRDKKQRRDHLKACLRESVAKDKECGICFDKVIEKRGNKNRFGILPNCFHAFCVDCILKWRKSDAFNVHVTRACPECRVISYFVCPSNVWPETQEQKDKILSDFRATLALKDCQYFQKGKNSCPFGNKCFFKHVLPNGDFVDVGPPQRRHEFRGFDYDLMDWLEEDSDDALSDDSMESEEINFFD